MLLNLALWVSVLIRQHFFASLRLQVKKTARNSSSIRSLSMANFLSQSVVVSDRAVFVWFSSIRHILLLDIL